MDYIKLLKCADLEGLSHKCFKVMAKQVAVFKEADGRIHAMEIACKHQNANLLEGKVVDDVATCLRHGWQYNLKTGECITGNSTPLRSYGIKIEGDDIFISIHPLQEWEKEQETIEAYVSDH